MTVTSGLMREEGGFHDERDVGMRETMGFTKSNAMMMFNQVREKRWVLLKVPRFDISGAGEVK